MGEALRIFRNPPPEEPIQIEPQLVAGQASVFGQADVVGNIGVFNNLHVGTSESPGIGGNVDVALFLFEAYNSPANHRGLRFFYSASSFPGIYGLTGWHIETYRQGMPEGIRDLTIQGGDNLVFGTASGAYWRIENNTGYFYPTNAGGQDIGSFQIPIQNIWSYGIKLVTYPSTDYGGLEADVVTALGSFLTMKQCTGVIQNPGATKLKLYVVTGTNANTLKLVAKAGAAGAQVTILDNIPT